MQPLTYPACLTQPLGDQSTILDRPDSAYPRTRTPFPRMAFLKEQVQPVDTVKEVDQGQIPSRHLVETWVRQRKLGRTR